MKVFFLSFDLPDGIEPDDNLVYNDFLVIASDDTPDPVMVEIEIEPGVVYVQHVARVYRIGDEAIFDLGATYKTPVLLGVDDER